MANNLLRAVQEDLDEIETKAGCRAQFSYWILQVKIQDS